jgi:hypothetical protein
VKLDPGTHKGTTFYFGLETGCDTFHPHHLSMGLLRSKLKEFLNLEQGNHTVFNYTR